MATNPFDVNRKVAYKNPFGVNVKSSGGSQTGIYNPQDGGWGQDEQPEVIEDFPQFQGNNNNPFNNNNTVNINNTGFNAFAQQTQPQKPTGPQNGQDNSRKQPFKPQTNQNPFAFNPNQQQQPQQPQGNSNPFENTNSALDMNFSMDDTKAPLKQQNLPQPKRFDPNQYQQQQQQYQQQTYTSSYENLGFDPNNVDPDNEPPLLVELGIDLNSIKVRTLSVLKFQKCDIKFLEDPDMSGPIILGFLFGFLLLLSGKMHFGYVYGFGISGTIGIYCIMNFLSMHKEIPLYNTLSILGYCLMPVIILSFFSVFISLRGPFGAVVAPLSIFWSTYSATNFFNELIHQEHQKYLVAYPIFLFYCMFVLLTIF